MVIGFVTGALVATSICLWRAAQRLPPTSLSPEAVALMRSVPLVGGGVVVLGGGWLGGVASMPKFPIWSVIGGLVYIVFIWLFVLYLLYRGERLLHQGTAMSSSSGQS